MPVSIPRADCGRPPSYPVPCLNTSIENSCCRARYPGQRIYLLRARDKPDLELPSKRSATPSPISAFRRAPAPATPHPFTTLNVASRAPYLYTDGTHADRSRSASHACQCRSTPPPLLLSSMTRVAAQHIPFRQTPGIRAETRIPSPCHRDNTVEDSPSSVQAEMNARTEEVRGRAGSMRKAWLGR